MLLHDALFLFVKCCEMTRIPAWGISPAHGLSCSPLILPSLVISD